MSEQPSSTLTVEEPEVVIGDSYLPLMLRQPPTPLLVEGSRGTGKTRAILSCLMADALAQPGIKIALCRSTRTRLTDTVLDTLESQVFPAFHINIPGGAAQRNRSEYLLPNGSRFLLRGLDDQARGQSFEATKIYVSEVSELDEVNDAMSLNASLRQPGFYGRCLIMDVNPTNPQNPFHLAAEECPDSLRNVNVRTKADYAALLRHNNAPAAEGRWKRIITTHKDNPGYWDHRAWDWTQEGRDYLATLEQYKGWLRSRWLDGLWKAASGVVFPEYDEDFHVIDDFEPPAEWPCVVGYDPGWHFTAILWMALAPDGGIFVFDEIYCGEKSVEEHCNEITARNKKHGRQVLRYFGDPNEMFSNRAQNVSCAQQARQSGLRFVPWPADKGAAFDGGVELVRRVLGNAKLDPPKSHYMKICRRCKGLRSNFSSWAFKKQTNGESPVGADKYQEGGEHSIDVGRGVLSSGFLQRYQR